MTARIETGVWRRQRPAAAACHCCSAHVLIASSAVLHMSCSSVHVLLQYVQTCCSAHVVGPWLSLGPGPVLYPAAACHMDQVSRVQKLIFSNYASPCLCSLARALTWVHTKLQTLSPNKRIRVSMDPPCHAKHVTVFEIRIAELSTGRPTCSRSCVQRTGCSRSCRKGACRPWPGYSVRVCQPNRTFHIPSDTICRQLFR